MADTQFLSSGRHPESLTMQQTNNCRNMPYFFIWGICLKKKEEDIFDLSAQKCTSKGVSRLLLEHCVVMFLMTPKRHRQMNGFQEKAHANDPTAHLAGKAHLRKAVLARVIMIKKGASQWKPFNLPTMV